MIEKQISGSPQKDIIEALKEYQKVVGPYECGTGT